MLEIKEIKQMLLRTESSKLYLADYPEMLRQKVLGSPALQPMLAEIRAEAEALLATAIPELSYTLFRIYFERGTRMEYETAYFNRRNRLRTFGLLAWLEPDNLVLRDALCDTLWAVCDEYTWCVPAHLAGEAENDPALPEGSIAAGKEVPAATIDLFSAETAFALAELLHLHGDNLPQLVRKRVISEVLHRVLIPFTERSFFGKNPSIIGRPSAQVLSEPQHCISWTMLRIRRSCWPVYFPRWTAFCQAILLMARARRGMVIGNTDSDFMFILRIC